MVYDGSENRQRQPLEQMRACQFSDREQNLFERLSAHTRHCCLGRCIAAAKGTRDVEKILSRFSGQIGVKLKATPESEISP